MILASESTSVRPTLFAHTFRTDDGNAMPTSLSRFANHLLPSSSITLPVTHCNTSNKNHQTSICLGHNLYEDNLPLSILIYLSCKKRYQLTYPKCAQGTNDQAHKDILTWDAYWFVWTKRECQVLTWRVNNGSIIFHYQSAVPLQNLVQVAYTGAISQPCTSLIITNIIWR